MEEKCDQAELHKISGKVKESLGKVTGNKELETEGKGQVIKGKLFELKKDDSKNYLHK